MAEKMLFSVDRIVGDIAVLEDDTGGCQNVPLAQLPAGIAEGSVLERTEEGYSVAKASENRRRQRVLSLQQRLRKKNCT